MEDKMNSNEIIDYTLSKLNKEGADKAQCRISNSEKKELNIIDSLVTYSTELNRDQYFGFVIANK